MQAQFGYTHIVTVTKFVVQVCGFAPEALNMMRNWLVGVGMKDGVEDQ